HTDGHIDTIVRFVNEKKLVCSFSDEKNDPNSKTMAENFNILLDYNKNHPGQELEIIKLPLPKKNRYLNKNRLPATYANFYIGNGFVVVPTYDDPHDALALEILRSLFPNREVIGLSSKVLIQGGGSFHCVTQQQPA
ncbi:MAG: agmatine deiminase family protein, partial [Silvanigrellaceae bacterium]|nr:agmatine deiminase family protein [Silvanigrellaceae bacterium]